MSGRYLVEWSVGMANAEEEHATRGEALAAYYAIIDQSATSWARVFQYGNAGDIAEYWGRP